MKVKVRETSGYILDLLVAKAEGIIDFSVYVRDTVFVGGKKYKPSRKWKQGGPIIEREKINPEWMPHSKCWMADCEQIKMPYDGDTPLEAAMRCYVAGKLGDEVEVPDQFFE